MERPEQDLDDPEYASFAWARFRRVLRWMAMLSAASAAAAVAILWWWNDGLPVHMGIATAIGVGLTIFLTAALMGLMFLSSGSGHDDSVDRFGQPRERNAPPRPDTD